MVLYDSSASISFSKIFLLILISLALTVLCVDLQYNEYSTTLPTLHTCSRMFVNMVHAVPLPGVVQDSIAQVVDFLTNGMQWSNPDNQTKWS